MLRFQGIGELEHSSTSPPRRGFSENLMTKDEWIARCATRYQERAGLTPEQAAAAAKACFEAESGEPGFHFSETAEYRPEDCADEDMSCWTDDGE